MFTRIIMLATAIVACCLGFTWAQNPPTAPQNPVTPNPVPGTQEPGVEPSTGTAPTAQDQRNDQNVKAVADRVFVAVDQLTPGDFPENSELKKSLQAVCELMARGKADETRKQLADLAAANPTLPPPGLLISGMLFAVNMNDAGHRELEKAATDNPQYPGIFTAFSRLAITQGRWADALAEVGELRRAIDAGTWNEDQKKQFESEFLDASADALTGREKYDEARTHLLELQKLLPDNASVLIRLADLDFRQEKIESAIKYLTEAHQKDSNIYVPELVLYQWYQRDGKIDDATSWMEKSAQTYPEDRGVQFEYGKYLLENGKSDEAAIWIDKADKNGANPLLTRFIRGQISYYRGAFAVAEADFKELNDQRPNDFGTKNMFALCLIESSDPAKRQRAYELAAYNMNANQNNVYAASTFGWVLYRLGNVPLATQYLTQVLRQPNVPTDSAFYVAHLFADEGRYENAVTLLNQALTAKGLFLNRVRAQDFLADVQNRLQKTGPTTNSGQPPKAGGQ